VFFGQLLQKELAQLTEQKRKTAVSLNGCRRSLFLAFCSPLLMDLYTAKQLAISSPIKMKNRHYIPVALYFKTSCATAAGVVLRCSFFVNTA
jgi:hypothetical protein